MTLQDFRNQFPDYAKDTKLNLSNVLSEEGAAGLSESQIYLTALASAYATKNQALIQVITAVVDGTLSAEQINAAKAAASIMAMNNVYYRFVHLVSDKAYGTMPANLRMTVIGNPGIDKIDFELMSLAVSSINGCGMCMDAHVREVIKGGIVPAGVQSSIRIAAVISAAAQVAEIENFKNE